MCYIDTPYANVHYIVYYHGDIMCGLNVYACVCVACVFVCAMISVIDLCVCVCVCDGLCAMYGIDRKVRYRKDELMSMSIKELRALLGIYSLSSTGCVDKRDMVDRLISSGSVDVIEGVPIMDMTRYSAEARLG